ncbi:MAG: AMP-binding protein [Caulobacteraceae bacterium]|nr:AMP-binding protein [Caulobacteraceae bacterium]
MQDAGGNIDWSEFGLVLHAASRSMPDSPQTIPEVISQALAKWPDKEALVGRYARYTYAALAEEIDAAASAMQALGVRAGDRVAATTANHTEIVVAFFAAQRLGAVWVGLNRQLAAPEKRFILEDSGASYYFAERAAAAQIEPLRAELPQLRAIVDMEPGAKDSGWAKMLAEHRGAKPTAPQPDPFAPAAIAYTSGTTGFPKGVVHSQHNIILVGAMQRRGAGRDIPAERPGIALPITILNLMILGPVAAFQFGRASILMDRIDTLGLAEWIREEKIEGFASVPTMMYDLMTNPAVSAEDLATLKYPSVGAAAMPESFREIYRQKFGRELSTSYGLTEAPTVVTVTDLDGAAIVPGASGVAAKHLRVSIQDPEGRLLPIGESGEICVAAADEGEFAGLYTPMLGYWRRADATASSLRGGWLHTGDMGRLDADGNLFVEGRRNDVILRGGSNVYPAEIERVLHMKDAVQEAAVIGRPDNRLGERVVAVVQLPAGGQASEALRAELEAHCRENLARYKVPEEWIFVDAMPRNAMNKVVKAKLREQHFGA